MRSMQLEYILKYLHHEAELDNRLTVQSSKILTAHCALL